MRDSSLSIDRVGAAAGFAFVLVFVALITSAPALPAPQHTITAIADSARDNRTGILVGVYLGMLLTGALLVFGGAVVARLWRAEPNAGGWWILAMAGLAGTAVPDVTIAQFVRAVQHGASGDELWVGYPVSPDGVAGAIPLAVFLFGVSGGRSGGALPRWLSRLALALSAMFVVGAAGVAFDEFGGPLGPVLLLAYLGMFVWTLGTSVVLWRKPDEVRADVAQSLA
jgi:hypothetical protein